MAAKRTIKTILDARDAIYALPVPREGRAFVMATWSQSMGEQSLCSTTDYTASLYFGGECAFRATGATPSDLYRNFVSALNRFAASKRIAAESARELARRAADPAAECHDLVRAGPRLVTARVVPRRLAGPA